MPAKCIPAAGSSKHKCELKKLSLLTLSYFVLITPQAGSFLQSMHPACIFRSVISRVVWHFGDVCNMKYYCFYIHIYPGCIAWVLFVVQYEGLCHNTVHCDISPGFSLCAVKYTLFPMLPGCHCVFHSVWYFLSHIWFLSEDNVILSRRWQLQHIQPAIIICLTLDLLWLCFQSLFFTTATALAALKWSKLQLCLNKAVVGLLLKRILWSVQMGPN